MAKARALDRRRGSIRSIRKITRTMELISTARFKRAMDRASAAVAYTRRITAIVGHLAHSEGKRGQSPFVRSTLRAVPAGTDRRLVGDCPLFPEVAHPLLQPRPEPKRAILLVLAANRGLCAGYNGNVLRLARARLRELKETVPEVRLEVSGKRGVSAFRFRKIQPDETFTHFEDKPTYAEVDVLATRYLTDFTDGVLDRLDVAYTKFHSASQQQAVVETLLPLGGLEVAEEKHMTAEPRYEYLPSAESILDEVVPTSFKVRLFKCFLDAAVSEQIARMVAMKAATENADGMISQLSMAYNRARQGQITGELLEIIGGAEAINE